jgi:hypothetical protein
MSTYEYIHSKHPNIINLFDVLSPTIEKKMVGLQVYYMYRYLYLHIYVYVYLYMSTYEYVHLKHPNIIK